MPHKTLTIIGILLILAEISGIPHIWKSLVAIAVGIFLIVLAIRGLGENKTGNRRDRENNLNDSNDKLAEEEKKDEGKVAEDKN